MNLLAKLDIAYPIFQAPMAGVATPKLAAAVSNAGGLGALGVASSTNEEAKAMILAAQARTTRPINVNVFCHEPPLRQPQLEERWVQFLAPLFAAVGGNLPSRLNDYYPSFRTNNGLLQVLLQTRPQVVSFHFGLPTPTQLALLKGAGIFTLATATNAEEAQRIEAAGLDGIVAQGYEAGGHRGMFNPQAADEKLSTLALVKQLSSQSRLPLIAAGGIMNGAHIKAALEAGASAVQMGTAFVACPESAAGPAYRRHLAQPQARTSLTATISGRPARGLVNRYIEYTQRPEAPAIAPYPVAYDATKQLQRAAAKIGNTDFGAHWAGVNAAQARPLPARQLVALLVREWAAAQQGSK